LSTFPSTCSSCSSNVQFCIVFVYFFLRKSFTSDFKIVCNIIMDTSVFLILSIPIFQTGLYVSGTGDQDDHFFISPKESDTIASISNTTCDRSTVLESFKTMLVTHSWSKDKTTSAKMKPVLMRLCARYLYQEKRCGYALNSVGKVF